MELTEEKCEKESYKNEVHEIRYKERFECVKKFIDKDFNILDLGCREGGYLRLLKNNGFENLTGVDISPSAVSICGDDINCICDDMARFLDSTTTIYDYIHMSHILEHFPYPKLLMNKVKNRLSDRGIVFIEIPFQEKKKFEKKNNAHYYFFEKPEDLFEVVEDFGIIDGHHTGWNLARYRAIIRKYGIQ